jgi:Na+/proline symporter
MQVRSFPMLDPWALGFGGALSVIGYLAIGLGSPGNPHILVRYMSIERPQLLRKAALIGTVWNVLMAWGAIFIGLVARAKVTNLVNLREFDAETVFPCLAAEHMHPFILGFMIASVFAAIMSTVDSQLLVASSAISRDIYQRIIKGGKEISEKRMVFISRVVILAMVVFATVIAIIAIKYPGAKHIVFWLVLFSWAGLGASFGTTILLALFWERTTMWGVFAGLVSGALTTIFWRTYPGLRSIAYELLPAFGVSLVLTVVVSLLTKPPEGAAEELDEIAAKY